MKVAFIGQKGVPATQGGVEKHVQELAVRLHQAKHDVVVYARPDYVGKPAGKYHLVNGKLQKRGQGLRVIILPSLPTKYFDTISHTLISILHAVWSDAEILHFQGDGPSLLIWLPKLLWPKIKIVATFHSADRFHQKWGPIARGFLKLGERLLCTVADEVIVVGRVLQQYVKTAYGRETHFIPNGVAPATISKRDQQKILHCFGLTDGRYIFMVSRLVQHKGAHHLIRAFQKLGRTDYDLVIAGAAAFTDAYVKSLYALAKNNRRIHFVGLQTGKKLAALYRGARVTVQPSESEGLSLVVLEAIAQSERVLVSDIPENLEIVDDFVPTFRSGDVVDLTRKLSQALKTDVSTLLKETKIALLVPYHWDAIVKETAKLYRQVGSWSVLARCHPDRSPA